MIMWLDFLIFGNGCGLKSPYFDDKFYWLKDSNTDKSELYTFMHGFGCQLESFQWTHPNAGEERRIMGRRFRPLHSTRRWRRVSVAWGMPDVGNSGGSIDEDNRKINELKRDLDKI